MGYSPDVSYFKDSGYAVIQAQSAFKSSMSLWINKIREGRCLANDSVNRLLSGLLIPASTRL